MLNNSLQQKIFGFLVLIIAFTIPIFQQVSIIVIVGLTITWLFQKNLLSKIILLKSRPAFILLIAYFLLHLCGLAWSKNLDYGWKDIETKLSFLILPLVIGTNSFTLDFFDKIKKLFVAGCILACIYCILNAVFTFLQTKDQTEFRIQ